METIKIVYLAFSVLLQIICLFAAIRFVYLMIVKKYGIRDMIFVGFLVLISLFFFIGISGNQLATVSGNVELVVALTLTAMGCVALICLLSYVCKKRLGF